MKNSDEFFHALVDKEEYQEFQNFLEPSSEPEIFYGNQSYHGKIDPQNKRRWFIWHRILEKNISHQKIITRMGNGVWSSQLEQKICSSTKTSKNFCGS